MTDDEIIKRCEAAGMVWLSPPTFDGRTFPGCFDTCSVDDIRALLAAPTPERAQESAGVRLTSEHIMEIADRYSTVEGDEIVEFARAVESAVLSANKEPQP